MCTSDPRMLLLWQTDPKTKRVKGLGDDDADDNDDDDLINGGSRRCLSTARTSCSVLALH